MLLQRDIKATVGRKDRAHEKHLTLKDGNNGTYAVAYELQEAGSHDFHITISGTPIQSSPYSVKLKGSAAPAPSLIRFRRSV